MFNVHPQYVVDENQQRRAVLINNSEWEQIFEELEELDDIRAYRDVKAQPSEIIPFEQAMREIEEAI